MDVSDLKPGDVVGWGGNKVGGHVAIYVGRNGMKFIFSSGPGK